MLVEWYKNAFYIHINQSIFGGTERKMKSHAKRKLPKVG